MLLKYSHLLCALVVGAKKTAFQSKGAISCLQISQFYKVLILPLKSLYNFTKTASALEVVLIDNR